MRVQVPLGLFFKMKTKIQIIQEVKEHFENNPRSLRASQVNPDWGPSCVYNGLNGEHCAFAIFVKDKYKPNLDAYEGFGASQVIDNLGFDIIKDEYKIENSDFWDDIQSFHDNKNYWEDNSLTEKGIKYYNELISKYRDK